MRERATRFIASLSLWGRKNARLTPRFKSRAKRGVRARIARLSRSGRRPAVFTAGRPGADFPERGHFSIAVLSAFLS